MKPQPRPPRPAEPAKTTTYADRQRQALEQLGLARPKALVPLGDLAARVQRRKTA